MNEVILNKIKGIIQNEIFKQNPNISLLALLKIETINSWDFVLAGKELDATADNLKWVADILRKELSPNEIISLSRLVLLRAENSFVQSINSTIEVSKDSNYMRIENYQIGKLLINEGYVMYSMPLVNN
jgi:hypothetical protein